MQLRAVTLLGFSIEIPGDAQTGRVTTSFYLTFYDCAAAHEKLVERSSSVTPLHLDCTWRI